MATGVASWSKTAATNATADANVNWAEGMAPSAVNNSARAEMASVAMWRDDISGTVTTGGTDTAYTITTNQVFGSAAAMSGALICFIPHTTSGAAPTLAVDGLTARAIRLSTGVNVPTGALIAGTPYTVTYVHATTEFILHGNAAVFDDVTLGDTTVATLTSSGAILGTTITGSGAISGATIAGGMVATQAQQETGTATNVAVTPGLQHYHPSAAKAWAVWNGVTGAITASYNVTSVTRSVAGVYNVVLATDFSSGEYSVVTTVTSGGSVLFSFVTNQVAGGFTVNCSSVVPVIQDCTRGCFVCFGDL